ncbi:MerR family transcriptional regulator [Microbacterium amylolyticum]|uniref:DNA-binding transcriptional MerR regulator n=1 Tax=Microbacterium amylolyticum TaxID=936337 RepID=A0ABS4ZJQ3_9MICO|nr:MerR family transcriptional regulator [Microbacterium amylolyticum]MBP2437514.1 DNA-binding transcriptional MerR regulator [Microbacterium amylolyticum]
MGTEVTDDTVMHIGELAERTGLSLRTIRHYDEIGLVTPSGRSTGGFRQYSADDLGRLMLIRRMKPLGYTLEQMAELLSVIDARSAGDDSEETAAALARFRADADARREKLAAQVAMADEFIDALSAR